MAERNSSSSRTTSERGGVGSTAASQSAGAENMGQTSTGSHDGLTDRLRHGASAQLNTQKDRATDGLGSVADAVRQSTRQLREQRHETIAGYVEQAADQIDRFSRGLKNKDVGELMRDAQRFAQRKPALFVGSAFAIGLAGARFFKSSSPQSEYEYERGRYGGGSYGGADYRGERGAGVSPATSSTGTAGLAGSTGGTGTGGTAASRTGRTTGTSTPSSSTTSRERPEPGRS